MCWSAQLPPVDCHRMTKMGCAVADGFVDGDAVTGDVGGTFVLGKAVDVGRVGDKAGEDSLVDGVGTVVVASLVIGCAALLPTTPPGPTAGGQQAATRQPTDTASRTIELRQALFTSVTTVPSPFGRSTRRHQPAMPLGPTQHHHHIRGSVVQTSDRSVAAACTRPIPALVSLIVEDPHRKKRTTSCDGRGAERAGGERTRRALRESPRRRTSDRIAIRLRAPAAGARHPPPSTAPGRQPTPALWRRRRPRRQPSR